MRHRRSMGAGLRRDALIEAVYREHATAVTRFFARRVAPEHVEDLTADAFVVAFRKLPADCLEPLPWLYGVAQKLLLNHRRKVKAHSRLVRAIGGRLAPPPAAPHDHVGDGVLKRAFAHLTQREREAICLVSWEGLTNEQAARVLGCSPATLAVRLSRARARLRTELDAADMAGVQPATDRPMEART